MNYHTNLFKTIFCLMLALTLCSCSTHPALTSPYLNGSKNTLKPHYAPVAHGRIEYYQFGHGSPIVLIPGYATDLTSWDNTFLNDLATHHKLIVLNNRNVGGSIVKSNSYNIKDLANDTYQLIEDLKLKKPAVLGISMGGMIAQELAILHPDKLGSLILINTAIAGHQAVRPNKDIQEKMRYMPSYRIARLSSALELFSPPSAAPQMTYALISDRFVPEHYKEADTAAIMPTQEKLVMNWIQDDAAAEKIASLQMPALVLNGDADIIIPPINSDILVDTIPNAQLKRWEHGGHGMIFQYPVSIADTVNQFLGSSSA